jgi:Na+/H+ antiporter NhaD/arsenite permease-like protein
VTLDPLVKEQLLKDIDYSRILFYVALFILAGSLADTGVFVMFYNLVIGQQHVSFTALPYRLALFMGPVSALLSPVSFVVLLAAACPFSSPREWMLIAWIASVTSNVSLCGSPAVEDSKYNGHSASSWTPLALFNVLYTIFSLFVGVFLLSSFNVSRDCSVKLGECEF